MSVIIDPKVFDFSSLLEQNDYHKICFALAHNVDYDEKQLCKKSEPQLITLLTKFKKITNAASAMPLISTPKQKISFIKSIFKKRPFYMKFLFPSCPENNLIEKLIKQPDQTEQLIQKEIEENIFNGIPDSYYLQKLLYIKFNLPKLKKSNLPKLTVNKEYPAAPVIKINYDSTLRRALSQKHYQ